MSFCRRLHPKPLSFHASVLEFAGNRRAWLDRQVRLLQTVAWWYVAPLGAGCLLFGWGATGGAEPAFALHAIVVLAVGTGIVLLNRWAVRRYLLPVRDDLTRLIETLESTDANGRLP
jgi:hypothetical protein